VTPGSELTWSKYFAGKKNPADPDRPWASFLQDMVYSDPDYLSHEKYLSFDFGRDYEAVRRRRVAGEPLDSVWNTRNRNLAAFAKAGGKVMAYHGWDDPNIPALSAIEFFDSIVADQARRAHLTSAQARGATLRFYRLYMVPGMGHCGGGPGPSDFGQPGHRPMSRDPEHDILTALDRWVEQGAAPKRLIASRTDVGTHKIAMTRPICPYPEEPRWNGKGDPDEAASFTCVVPKSTRHTAS
jgi:feruloyl esterase